MRTSSILSVVIIVVLAISVLCVWFYPSVQDFMATNSMWNGIKEFMDDFEAKDTSLQGELPVLPEETVLVVIPYIEYNDEELSKIKRFVENGGILLLMDDYGYGNGILAYLGLNVRFSNKPLLDPLINYRNQAMPRITDFSPEVKDSGVEVIMLNRATALTGIDQANALAWSSAASFLDADENGAWSDNEPKGPFPVAANLRYSKGTVAIIADPSIIISSMLSRDDNRKFLEYMTGDADERKEILFDSSHLTRTPLDVSKTRLIGTRQLLSSPYILVGITALVFAVVSRYTLRKGEAIG